MIGQLLVDVLHKLKKLLYFRADLRSVLLVKLDNDPETYLDESKYRLPIYLQSIYYIVHSISSVANGELDLPAHFPHCQSQAI